MWLSLNPCDHTRTVGAHPYVHCCQKCKHRKTEGSLQLQCLAGVQYWSSPSLESNTLLHSPSIKPSSLFPLPSTISLPLRNVCLFLCWFPSSPRWFRRCIPICHAQPHLCYSHHFLLGFLPAYLKLFCSLSYFFSFFFNSSPALNLPSRFWNLNPQAFTSSQAFLFFASLCRFLLRPWLMRGDGLYQCFIYNLNKICLCLHFWKSSAATDTICWRQTHSKTHTHPGYTCGINRNTHWWSIIKGLFPKVTAHGTKHRAHGFCRLMYKYVCVHVSLCLTCVFMRRGGRICI